MKSTESSNLTRSTNQSFDYRTFQRIEGNPRVCARFALACGPRERRRGANQPNFANPLCARFPYVRPHGTGGVPIGGSEPGAGLSFFFRLQRAPESASPLAASERCVLRTAGTPKSRPEKENRD